MINEESGNYDQNANDFAEHVWLYINGVNVYDLNDDLRFISPDISLDEFNNLSLNEQKQLIFQRNEIWIRAALFVKLEFENKMELDKMSLLSDIRFINFDSNCVSRLKGGCKKNNLMKISELPSIMASKLNKNDKKDDDTDKRKLFLRQFSNK